jgi:hypothetical protein
MNNETIAIGTYRHIGTVTLFYFHLPLYGGKDRCTGFWWGDLRDADHLEVRDVDGRIILKWVFKKWDGRHGLD